MSLKDKPVRAFGMRDKLSYAAGDAGCNCSFALAGTFFTLFYTQYLGIDSITFAAILIVLKIWDAINDPLIGGLFDSSKKSMRTKFNTYCWVGSVGLVIAATLCFLPIVNAAKWIKIILCVLGYVCWDACYTIINVPYGCVAANITAEPGERAQLSVWRNLGAMVVGMLVGIVVPMLVYDANDNLLGSRLFFVALILGILGFIFFQVLRTCTTIRIEGSVAGEGEKFNYFKAFKNFLTNRGAMGVTFAIVSYFMSMYGGMTTIAVMFQSYFHNASISGLMSFVSYIPILFVMPFISKIVRKYGKKEAAQTMMLISILAGILMIVLPISNDGKGMLLYIICSALSGVGMSVFMSVSYAMVSDSIDYNEWKSGSRNEGTVYALHSFFRKLAQGIGPSIVLVIMVALGYSEQLGANQPFEVALNMRYLVAGLTLFAAIASWVCVRFWYNIDKKTLSEMETALGRSIDNTQKEAPRD